MSAKFTPGPWTWFRGYLVTANKDMSVPLSANLARQAIARATGDDSESYSAHITRLKDEVFEKHWKETKGEP